MKAVVYCAGRSSGIVLKTLPRPIFNKSNNNQVLCKVTFGGLNPVSILNLCKFTSCMRYIYFISL